MPLCRFAFVFPCPAYPEIHPKRKPTPCYAPALPYYYPLTAGNASKKYYTTCKNADLEPFVSPLYFCWDSTGPFPERKKNIS